jgi:hypothetical protein
MHSTEYSWLSGIFLLAFITGLFDGNVIGYSVLWIPLIVMRSLVKTQHHITKSPSLPVESTNA